MNPETAQKIADALHREIERRRRKRDDADEQTWLAEDPTAAWLVAKMAQRLCDRLDKPLPGPPPVEPASSEAIDELAASLDHLSMMD
jgi:hypothetical protein